MKNNIVRDGEETRQHLTIKDWSKEERPRERFLLFGEDTLSDAELIAILLRTGVRGITAVELAKLLLNKFDLQSLAKLDLPSLKKIEFGESATGTKITLGPARAITLATAFSLARRMRFEKSDEKKKILTSEDVYSFFYSRLSHLPHEEFHLLLLDSANQRIMQKRVSQGILNASLVHPREVFRIAITENAASIILVHNHPSGNPEPSSEDISITRKLVEVGKIMDIPIHDHIIIAGEKYTSFADRRLL
ncbi:MAG: DNA repair protein RadC [Ignavibacteriales bacterium]|nr:DNA repair protein RadC [Ignavibacteriales bacterium]